MTSNKRNSCEQALPESQDGEEKTSDALLDVLIETDTKPFIYDVDENPPLFMTICFAMQQLLMSLSSSMSTTLLVADVLCAKADENFKARLLSTTMFMSGITTFLQNTLGVRLPLYQGPAATFVVPLLALSALPDWQCADDQSLLQADLGNSSTSSINDAVLFKAQQLAGSLMIAGTFQMLVGLTGLIGLLLRFVGPITVVPPLTIIGLQVYKATTRFAKAQWGVAILTMATALILSFYLQHRRTPIVAWSRGIGFHIKWFPLQKVFSILFACLLGWAVSAILTVAGVLSDDPKSDQFYARTDSRLYVVEETKWFVLPYPGQFGSPGIHVGALVTFLLSTISSIIDSVGDYYACAKMVLAPPPPKHAINRGIAIEGMMSLIGGSAGTSHATSTFASNIGAMGITRVASVRVFQAMGLLFILFGVIGKIGAVFITVPYPVVGGMMVINFGVLIGVMLSNLQLIDLDSTRNLAIIGISMLLSLIFPYWIETTPDAIDTGIAAIDDIIPMFLANPAFIAGFVACFLDNTIPGTIEERGMHHWQAELGTEGDDEDNEKSTSTEKSDSSTKDKLRQQRLLKTIYTVPFARTISKRFPFLKYLPFYPR